MTQSGPQEDSDRRQLELVLGGTAEIQMLSPSIEVLDSKRVFAMPCISETYFFVLVVQSNFLQFSDEAF